jgi:hypothetical protein
MIDSLLIAPAERYIIEILPTKAGTFALEYKNPAFTEQLATITVLPTQDETDAAKIFTKNVDNANVRADIDNYRPYFDKEIDKTLRFDMTLYDKTSEDMSLQMHPHRDGTTAQL